jgi:hypothetical protein
MSETRSQIFLFVAKVIFAGNLGLCVCLDSICDSLDFCSQALKGRYGTLKQNVTRFVLCTAYLIARESGVSYRFS